MGSRYEVEVTIVSAKDLKNVNWRRGALKPYAVVWVDPASKCATRVDNDGDTSPFWDETLRIPFTSPIEDSSLHVDVVHSGADEDAKPLIGSARLRLRDILDDDGIGARVDRKLELKRPSGRPHGKLEVRVCVRETRHRAPEPYYAPPYGVPAPPQPYGYPYGAPPVGTYGAPPVGTYGERAPPVGAYAAPPVGYPSYGAPAPSYGAPAPVPSYGATGYGQPEYGQAGAYGQGQYEEKKKSKFGGMGTGLAVGAVAGVLGGLALAEGAEYVEDKIADDAAEKVEDDAGGYDAGGDDW